MSIMDKFVEFFKTSDPERRAEIEDILKRIMLNDQSKYSLTPEQEADLSRRLKNPNNRTVTQAEIEEVCGRPMP